MNILRVKKGREKSLLRHHPWIFSGAVDTIDGNPGAGDTVTVLSWRDEFLATAFLSPSSQIRSRVWTFDGEEKVDRTFFMRRIALASSLRDRLFTGRDVNAYRMVASESDGLPGLVVDRYGEFLVCQFLTAGADRWKGEITSCLDELLSPSGIYERSDAETRAMEGLPVCNGLLSGGEPPELIPISEEGVRILVDARGGHKTGFYLDQRENRLALTRYAPGKRMLNCFSYTGGFTVHALKAGGEHVTSVDTSGPALELLEKNLELNGLDTGRHRSLRGDVFQVLRRFRNDGERFDLVVLDPPKFVDSRAHLERAARGYKDINRLAMEILSPGGILFTFSCSGLLDADLFHKIVADAALDAGRDAFVLERLTQAPDHGWKVAFPEGFYLKGLVLSIN